MLELDKYRITSKFMLSLCAILVLAYLFPFFGKVSYAKINLASLAGEGDSMREPLIRSLLYAISTSLFATSFALLISLLLKSMSLYSKAALLLSCLLLPVIAGTISSAFIWKIVLGDHPFFFHSPAIKLITTSLIHFWQYGSLFVYIFWLNEQVIAEPRQKYSSILRTSSFERIRDFVLPAQKNLFILLYIVGFITFFYDDTAMELIFKGSRGTHTEMIGQWLLRTYHSKSMISPSYGFSNISGYSFVVFIIAFLGICLLGLVVTKVFDALTLFYQPLKLIPEFGRKTAYLVLAILLIIILLPVLITVLSYVSSISIDLRMFLFPLFMTLIASIFATVTAIEFAIGCRLVFKKWLNSLNSRSLLGITVLLLLLLAPPIVMLLCGFQWMQIVGYTNPSYVYVVWVLSHVVLSFPLLAAFAVAMHFRRNNKMIDYSGVINSGIWEKKRDIFYKTFRADYLLILLLAFCSIWNESTINNVLSDLVPSFASEINKTISGKSEDFTVGVQYLLVALSLSIVSILVWNSIIIKIQSQKQGQ